MSREQVRAVDRWAIETIGVWGVVLMENAGRCAADVACAMLGEPEVGRVAILAGAGNNAGDGFVVARHLLVRGIPTDVYLLAPPEKIRGDAKINLDAMCRLGLKPIDARGRTIAAMTDAWRPYDLLIDAVGGTGIVGDLRDDLADAVEAANATGVPILAIDIPTGLNCDTGRPQGPTIRARKTVTFVATKMGFSAKDADTFTGEVIVADIGVPIDRLR